MSRTKERKKERKKEGKKGRPEESQDVHSNCKQRSK